MDVIRHQAIGVNRAPEAHGKAAQVVEVRDVVRLLEEAIIAIMATLHDVQTQFGNLNAGCPRHKPKNGATGARLTSK
jgi:tRNA-dihydrouridine synthase